jgi:hypothetical protein
MTLGLPVLKGRIAGTLLVAIVSLACSERTLTPERAASLIAGLDQFKREAYFSIQTGVPLQTAFKCLDQAEIARAPLISFGIERGWVRLESRETVLGFATKTTCPTLALTQSGEAASTRWTRQRGGSGEGVTWAVPIGRRRTINVTKLTTARDGSTQVEFDWKWMPTETGMVLRKFVPQRTPSSTRSERVAHHAVGWTISGNASSGCGRHRRTASAEFRP